MRLKARTWWVVSALTTAFAAHAQSNDALKSAIQKALDTNPDVSARFNAYRASVDAIDAARGGFYPRLDLSAGVGRDRDSYDNRNPETQSINRSGAALSVTQLLWDGLATKNEVDRLEHDRLARYFEVVDVSEATALEAARAYYDVLRFRRLVQLAEDNYVQHRSAFNLLNSRYQAGVGRGVDLEQAGARLALAESNLTTEVANLHDVSARYQRTVGEVPPPGLPLPVRLSNNLPVNANDASAEALRRSAAVSASVEALRSARETASRLEGAYQPRVEARVRSGAGNNLDGNVNQRRDSTAELVLNWNLFNGGTDRARVRQQVNIVNQAGDQRDKICRDVRQTVSIAYNDTRKLVDQLAYLDRNTLAIAKARDAYRQQFEIGQRSLLDLLNSENELYTARRSYANAEYDLGIAYARAHAAMSQLAVQVGLARHENLPETPDGASGWSIENDGPVRCPPEVVSMPVVDFAELDKRVQNRAPAVAPAPAVVTPPAPAASPAGPGAAVQRRLNDWAAAWQARDVPRYLAFYAPDFVPSDGSRASWLNQRRAQVSKEGALTIKLEGVQTQVIAPDRVETRFRQTYQSSSYSDVVDKTLVWQNVRGEWLIVRETLR